MKLLAFSGAGINDNKMMLKKEKYVRIGFRIEETVLQAWQGVADEQLKTKSALLIEWLQVNDGKVQIISSDQFSGRRQYQTRVPAELAKKIFKLAQKLNVTRSTLLRNIVKQNLLAQAEKEPLDLFLITKTYLGIEKEVEEIKLQQEGFTPEADLLLMRANIEIGPVDIPSIENKMVMLRQVVGRSQNKNNIVRLKIIEGELLMFKGDLRGGIQILNEAKVIAYRSGDYLLLSDIFYIIALGLHLAGEIKEAIYNYENALEYITIQEHPYHYGRIYLHLAMMEMFMFNLEQANKYLAKSSKLINKTETPHYWVIQKTIQCYWRFIGGDMEGLEIELQKCMQEFVAMKSMFGAYNAAQSLAKIYLTKGEVHLADKLFNKVGKIEEKAGQKFSLSRSSFYKEALIKQDIDKVKLMIESKRAFVKVDVEEYILAYALLKNDNKAGKKILKRLIKDGATPLIRAQAKKTLDNQQFYPVTVI